MLYFCFAVPLLHCFGDSFVSQLLLTVQFTLSPRLRSSGEIYLRLRALLHYLGATFLKSLPMRLRSRENIWGYVPRVCLPTRFRPREQLIWVLCSSISIWGLRLSSLFIFEAMFLGCNLFSCFVPLLFIWRLHSWFVYLRGYVPSGVIYLKGFPSSFSLSWGYVLHFSFSLGLCSLWEIFLEIFNPISITNKY